MSPDELEPLEADLIRACELLGWERYETEVQHERDSSRSWTERGWRKDGEYLISEEDMSEGMACELIRIAGALPR